MMRVLAVLLALAVAGLACTLQHASGLRHDLTQAQGIVGTLSAGLESRDKAIARLQDEARTLADQEQTLRQAQSQAGALALQRELQIQREHDADESLRAWSAAALPDAAKRLHQRPAFSNARDYLAWLSTRDQLPDPRQ